MRGDSEERLRELTERVWLLEQELAALRRDLGRGAPPVAPPEGRPGWPATGLTVAPAAPPATWPAPPEQRPVPPGPPPGWAPPPSAPGAPEAGWPPAAPPAAVTAPAPAALSGPSAASAAPAPAAWPGEWLARLGGGNWLARVGVLVLGLGVVYFLQLAFSNDWIPLWARAALGVGGGLALAVAGEVLRRRGHDTTYAQILAGGGASIAYVTVYAAYALPHYRAALHLTLPVEILLLAAVSAALATYAYRRDLPVLATVAVVQAALLVAPAGDFSEAGIAVFLLLGSGVFAASHRPGWQVPMLSAAVAGAASHVAAAFHPDVDARATAVGIAVLSVLGVAAARRDGSGRGEARFVALMLPLATAFVWWHVSGAVWHGSPAWALLAAAALSLAAALAGRRVAGPLALAGAVLLLVWPRAAFPASLGQPSAYAALAALAAGLAAASVAARASATRGGLPASLQRARGGRWPVRAHVAEAAAAAYLVAATLSLFLVAAPRGLAQQHPWWAGLLALAVASLGLGMARGHAGRADPAAPVAAGACAAALLLLWPFVQVQSGLGQPALHVAAAAAIAALLAAATARGSGAGSRLTLHAALAVAVAGAMLSLLLQALAHGVADSRPAASVALAAAAVLLAGIAWLARRSHANALPAASVGLACGALLLHVWPTVQWGIGHEAAFAHAAVALAASAAAWRWPAEARVLAAIAAGTATLGLAMLLAAAAGGAAGPDLPWWLAAAAVLAAAGALWWRAGMPPAGVPPAVARGLGLAAATAAALLAVPVAATGWPVTVGWATVALAVAAAAVALRDPLARHASFAAFGLVVARVFLHDLRGLSPAARVLAFLLTGSIMVLAAFLYARQRRREAAPPADIDASAHRAPADPAVLGDRPPP